MTLTPVREQLVRADAWPSWDFAGSMAEGKAIVEAECFALHYSLEDGVHCVSGRYGITSAFATADSEAEAWRVYIGCYLGTNQPSPDEAMPGETLQQFKVRLLGLSG